MMHPSLLTTTAFQPKGGRGEAELMPPILLLLLFFSGVRHFFDRGSFFTLFFNRKPASSSFSKQRRIPTEVDVCSTSDFPPFAPPPLQFFFFFFSFPDFLCWETEERGKKGERTQFRLRSFAHAFWQETCTCVGLSYLNYLLYYENYPPPSRSPLKQDIFTIPTSRPIFIKHL